MTRTVAFDEAGNTGEDLLNLEQPVFSLASVLLSRRTASALASHQGKELHFRTARRSRRGRSEILRVLTDPRLAAETVRATAMHKPFSVVAKMVDLLVEPVAARSGYDLYAEGAHLALSNVMFATMPVMCGAEPWTRILERFVVMCREPTREQRADFVLTLGDVARQVDSDARAYIRLLAVGAAAGEFGGSGIPDLDPAPPCLVALSHAWAADGEPFGILHDDRTELRRWEPFLAEFWRERDDVQTFVLYDGRTITYPLPVTSLSMAASHTDPRLQVADLVAGAIQMVLNAEVGIRSDPTFAATLRNDTPIMSWLIHGSVWPTLDMDPTALGVKSGAANNLADALAVWLGGHASGHP